MPAKKKNAKPSLAETIRGYLGSHYQDSDEQLISLYCETHAFYERLRDELETANLLTNHTNKHGATNTVKNPLIIELTKTVQTLNNLLKSLGLTAAQRKKMIGGDDHGDDFDKF